jgi:hypothetical protein
MSATPRANDPIELVAVVASRNENELGVPSDREFVARIVANEIMVELFVFVTSGVDTPKVADAFAASDATATDAKTGVKELPVIRRYRTIHVALPSEFAFG